MKGAIFFLSLSLSAFLLFAALEYLGNFNTSIRTGLFYGYLAIAGFGLVRWVGYPIKQLLNLDNELSDEEAAKQIGAYFPEIKDKLLNTIQLAKSNSDNSLIAASIAQRSQEIKDTPFRNAIKIGENKKYFNKYMLIPLVLFLLFFVGYNKEFKSSTDRIIKHNEEFVQEATFSFVFLNDSTEVFRGDSYIVKLKFDGEKIPSNSRIVIDGQSFLMNVKNEEHTYVFPSVLANTSFKIESAGFSSKTQELSVIDRPQLNGLKIHTKYPSYVGLENKVYENTGSFSVPEGTRLNFEIITDYTDSVSISFNNSEKSKNFNNVKQKFQYEVLLKESIDYTLSLKNLKSKNKDKITYKIDVIKDEFPTINITQIKDTIFYNNVMVAGKIGDDYGVKKLDFVYTNKDNVLTRLPIAIRNNVTSQEFFFQKTLEELDIEKGSTLEFYFEVYDNDQINGSKRTKSKYLTFVIPSKDELENKLEKDKEELNNAYENSLSKSEELKEELSKLTDELKSKKSLDWQDKANIEQLLNKHKNLKKELDQNKEKYDLNKEKEQQLSEEEKALLEKMKQLDELMKNVMDEEFQKMMEELQKMMEENASDEKIKEKLEELEEKDESLQQQLDRNIEMMKKFQLEQKLNNIQKDLEDLAKKQKELAKETAENKDKDKNEELSKKQEELNKEFEKLKEEYKKAEELNKDLENSEKLEDFSQKEESIEQSQQDSKEQLDKNQNQKSSESQKNAAQKIQEMSDSMKSMMEGMQGEQLQENIDDLKALLENLIHLSYSQENLMDEFRKINQRDPRFIELSQEQIKLNGDSRIIKDSLIALAKRIPEIETFVMDEVNDLAKYMGQSSTYIKERLPQKASSKQQFAMTSANNLAVMLSDVLQNMQEQMAQQKSNQGKPSSMCNKPGGSKPSSSGMQKQMKSMKQMMKDIKDGKKQGRGLSQQLSQMAAQQEMMRQAYQKLLKKQGGKTGGKEATDKMKEAIEMMKENEKDIINNRISQNTLDRQQEIQTRMLEFDKAEKERDLDKERKAETAEQKIRKQPSVIEEFLKEKEKQLELLKTIPPDLKLYYRKKINEYFQGVENQK